MDAFLEIFLSIAVRIPNLFFFTLWSFNVKAFLMQKLLGMFVTLLQLLVCLCVEVCLTIIWEPNDTCFYCRVDTTEMKNLKKIEDGHWTCIIILLWIWASRIKFHFYWSYSINLCGSATFHVLYRVLADGFVFLFLFHLI